MRVSVVAGDITQQRVDVIVNAANAALLPGGGVCGAIFRAAGPALEAACGEVRRTTWPDGLPTGKAVETGAGNLPSRWVIHTVGPVHDSREDRSELLRSCYVSALTVAARLGARSVAFPLISAGIFGWPLDDAARQAVAGIREAEAAGVDVDDVVIVAFPETNVPVIEAALSL